MTIAFVRHGQTEANRDGVMLGLADPTLTATGRVQAERLAARMADEPVHHVRSSPLRRCRETAALIAVACGAEVTVDERLVELDYGEWDLVPFAEIPEAAATAWRHDPAFAPPGGESLRAVSSRIEGFCEEQLEHDATVVAVSHVSPIKAAVAWSLGADPLLAWRMRLEVASVTRIGGTRAGPLLLTFNETDHLA